MVSFCLAHLNPLLSNILFPVIWSNFRRIFSGQYLMLILILLMKNHGDVKGLIYLIFSTLKWMRISGKTILNNWYVEDLWLWDCEWFATLLLCFKLIHLCYMQEQLRLESTMKSKIHVYESGRSEKVAISFGTPFFLITGFIYGLDSTMMPWIFVSQDYDPDLPPELAAASLQDISADNSHVRKNDGGQIDLLGQGGGTNWVRPQLVGYTWHTFIIFQYTLNNDYSNFYFFSNGWYYLMSIWQ